MREARAPEQSDASGSSPTPEAGTAGREAAGGEAAIYEVFRQERKGQAFQHAGSFRAPDDAFARAYAREFFGRRGESTALWLVPRAVVLQVDDFPGGNDTAYRRVDGYSLKSRLREARDRATESG